MASQLQILSLGDLPLDILKYIVYDTISIQDYATLRAISQTCRSFRDLAFRRLSSEKVTLNLNLSGHTELLKNNIAKNFLASENHCSIGLIKELHININTLECGDLRQFEEFNQLITDVGELVDRCRSVETAVVREHTGANPDEVLDAVEWASRFAKLPKLKVLFLDPCHRHHFRSIPDDQYIKRIEDADYKREPQKGLECLSIQPVSNKIYRDDYSIYTPLVQSTLRSNVDSLSRLWFNGPELREALEEMPTGSLANMRLRSLSIRNMETHEPFVRVFGLRLRQDRASNGTITKEDAMSTLEALYLSDGRFPAEPEVEFLSYLHTPKLTSLQVGSRMFHPRTDHDRLSEIFHSYLQSFSSLRRFGATIVKERSKAEYSTVVRRVAVSQPNLKTLAVWNSWGAFDQLLSSKTLLSQVQFLDRLETSAISTNAEQGLLQALGSVVRTQSGADRPFTALSIGQMFWEQQYFAPREICTIVSTILYVHQKRLDPATPFTKLTNESQTSPLVETPARQAFFDAIAGQRTWPKSFILRYGQRNAVRKYLSSLASTVPPGRCKWNARPAGWDRDGQKNKEAVVNGMCEAVMYELNEGFKRLEVEWKTHRAGLRWPSSIEDWRFVWEKTSKGWELLEYV
ncbi:hypothetical protein TWF281_004830 [Arthrobotrys megalospora]